MQPAADATTVDNPPALVESQYNTVPASDAAPVESPPPWVVAQLNSPRTDWAGHQPFGFEAALNIVNQDMFRWNARGDREGLNNVPPPDWPHVEGVNDAHVTPLSGNAIIPELPQVPLGGVGSTTTPEYFRNNSPEARALFCDQLGQEIHIDTFRVGHMEGLTFNSTLLHAYRGLSDADKCSVRVQAVSHRTRIPNYNIWAHIDPNALPPEYQGKPDAEKNQILAKHLLAFKEASSNNRLDPGARAAGMQPYIDFCDAYFQYSIIPAENRRDFELQKPGLDMVPFAQGLRAVLQDANQSIYTRRQFLASQGVLIDPNKGQVGLFLQAYTGSTQQDVRVDLKGIQDPEYRLFTASINYSPDIVIPVEKLREAIANKNIPGMFEILRPLYGEKLNLFLQVDREIRGKTDESLLATGSRILSGDDKVRFVQIVAERFNPFAAAHELYLEPADTIHLGRHAIDTEHLASRIEQTRKLFKQIAVEDFKDPNPTSLVEYVKHAPQLDEITRSLALSRLYIPEAFQLHQALEAEPRNPIQIIEIVSSVPVSDRVYFREAYDALYARLGGQFRSLAEAGVIDRVTAAKIELSLIGIEPDNLDKLRTATKWPNTDFEAAKAIIAQYDRLENIDVYTNYNFAFGSLSEDFKAAFSPDQVLILESLVEGINLETRLDQWTASPHLIPDLTQDLSSAQIDLSRRLFEAKVGRPTLESILDNPALSTAYKDNSGYIAGVRQISSAIYGQAATDLAFRFQDALDNTANRVDFIAALGAVTPDQVNAARIVYDQLFASKNPSSPLEGNLDASLRELVNLGRLTSADLNNLGITP